MDFDLFAKTVDEFLELASLFRMRPTILLSGGEPLMHPQFFTMLDYITKKIDDGFPIILRILTNGILVNEPTIAESLLIQRKYIYEMQVSIDGDKDVHNQIRSEGAWEKAIKAIGVIGQVLNISVAVSCVVSRMNYKVVSQIVENAVENHVRRINFSRFVPVKGEGETNLRDMVLSEDELRVTWETLYGLSDKLLSNVISGKSNTYINMHRCDLWHLADEQRAKQQWDVVGVPRYLLQGLRCMVGANIIAVMPSGDVYPCRRLPTKIGNISKEKMKDIWMNNQFLKDMRNRGEHMTGKCKHCVFLKDRRYRMLCSGGGACITTSLGGSIYDPDPQCWKRVQQRTGETNDV